MQFNVNDYKAFLFDFDGVIANTMHDNHRAWYNALKPFGIELIKEEYFILEGIKAREVAKIFLNKVGKDTEKNIEKVVSSKEEQYLKIMNFSLYPGVKEILKKLKNKNIKTAIVTGASKNRFLKSIEEIKDYNFTDLFNEIITADHYDKGKPNPEPYLAAVNKLGLKPEECLVIENAPLGITSAKNAKIKIIAICSTLDKNYLSDADLALKDISTLLKTLIWEN